MWLVGVVVRRYIDFLIILLFATPLVLAIFCSGIPTSLLILKMFFGSLYMETPLLSLSTLATFIKSSDLVLFLNELAFSI